MTLKVSYNIKKGTIVIYERPNQVMKTETWPYDPPICGSCFCTDNEIVERGEVLFKIHRSFYPPDYYVYVREVDLIPEYTY